jgi:hypothetical protein
VQASDIFEEIWTRDIVDLTWEIFRYRRLKTSLIAAGVEETLTDILSSLVELPEVEEGYEYEQESESADSPEHELAQQWVARDPAAIEQVKKLLASAGLTMDSMFAQVLARKIGNIERIDYLTTVAEGRRNAVMREIDRHRATLAQKLHGAVREIEVTKFEPVKPLKTIGSKKWASKGAA